MQAGPAIVTPAPVGLIYKPHSIVEPLRWDAIFPQVRPLEVELGSGDGTFLVEYARRHPDRNFLGVERLLGRLRKIDRKGRRAGLDNLRLLRLEAGYVVEYLLPPASVNVLHIYFPDPWPKRKHKPKRLINERFGEMAAQALAPNGLVYLRTDDHDYFAQMSSVFGATASYRAVDTPDELLAMTTDFERDFLARGVSTLRAAYQRREG